MNEYVTKLESGAYRVAGTRVSLDSVVYAYRRGHLPETIARNFPSLSLARIYGAIAFYLSNQEKIDEYLKQEEIEYEKLREADPEFYARFDRVREKMKQENLLAK